MLHCKSEWVMSHVSRHAAHMNESCPTYEWVMCHVWMRHVQRRIMILCLCKRLCGCMRTRHVPRMNGWLMSYLWNSHVPLMNEACPTYEWVMSHTWISHVPQTNEACLTYEWVMSHVWMHHVPRMNEWVMSHVWMSHVPRMNTSGHIYKWGNFRRAHKFLCAWASMYCHASVTSHIWMSRVTNMKDWRHTCEYVMSRGRMTCVNDLCEWVVSSICVNELPHQKLLGIQRVSTSSTSIDPGSPKIGFLVIIQTPRLFRDNGTKSNKRGTGGRKPTSKKLLMRCEWVVLINCV